MRSLFGKPEVIGKETMHPLEMLAFGVYNPDRDGNMSEKVATGSMLRSALNHMCPGAPMLL
jgi:hypothetical protein